MAIEIEEKVDNFLYHKLLTQMKVYKAIFDYFLNLN